MQCGRKLREKIFYFGLVATLARENLDINITKYLNSKYGA
jgi:hypothetical protein